MRRLAVRSLVALCLCSASWPASWVEGAAGSPTYAVGLRVEDFDYVNPQGRRSTITAAVWYPTDEAPAKYTYQTRTTYQSRLAFNARQVAPAGPFPLIVYVHGGFSSGYASACFMEYLAKHGFIVIAPDYVDTKPPAYTEPIAFDSIKKGQGQRALAVLRAAREWVRDMSGDRPFFLSYLATHRFDQTSSVIDKMLSLNRDRSSIFHQTIAENAVGAVGWSEGGITVIGKTGGHPDPKWKDARIKAALLLSAPAYPFESAANPIEIPTMLMAGDNDAPGLRPEFPRKMIYEKVRAARYYLVLRDANHFAFGNRSCGQTSFDQAVETVPQARAISHYALAFFGKYLRGDPQHDAQLSEMDPAWAYFLKEEQPGQVQAWGTEPAPRGTRPLGIGR